MTVDQSLSGRRTFGATILILTCLLGACGVRAAAVQATPPAGREVAMAHARTFTVVERDGYRIVDLKASVMDWGGAARGPRQHVRLVMVPRESAAPALEGDLATATIIRTPVERIAVNAGPHEAILTALGVEDRLVAVGGTFSYNEGIRDRVMARQIRQIGYGWHLPPELDVLVDAQPDILLMALGDLDHIDHLERIRSLGIPVMPTFIDAEPHYLGRIDYVRLIGMLTGREREAEAYVSTVEANVARLRALAATRPPRPMLHAWYSGGDRWMATVRNAEARLIRDAGGINLMQRPDDPDRDSTMWVSTEALLAEANGAECWIMRDDHSSTFQDRRALTRFAAWREGCMFAINGMTKPHINAYDYYERGLIRPDLVLADLIGMLHPELGAHNFVYIIPDDEVLQP